MPASFLVWLFVVLVVFIALTVVFNGLLLMIFGKIDEAVKAIHRLTTPKVDKVDPSEKEAEKILREAREKANQMVTEAALQAAKIDQDVKLQSQEVKAALQAALSTVIQKQSAEVEKVTKDYLEETRNTLKKISDGDINSIQNISKDIEDQIKSNLDTFQKAVLSQTMASQKGIQDKVEEAYREMMGRVKAVEDERLKKVDDQIFNVLMAVSKKVLGRTMPIVEHERLVMESLEKAKKQDFFVKDE